MDTHYRYMLHYIVEGEKDPERENIYNKLIIDIYTLADDAAEQLLVQESPSFFFERSRVQNVRPPLSIDTYADTLSKQSIRFLCLVYLRRGQKKKAGFVKTRCLREHGKGSLLHGICLLKEQR